MKLELFHIQRRYQLCQYGMNCSVSGAVLDSVIRDWCDQASLHLFPVDVQTLFILNTLSVNLSGNETERAINKTL